MDRQANGGVSGLLRPVSYLSGKQIDMVNLSMTKKKGINEMKFISFQTTDSRREAIKELGHLHRTTVSDLIRDALDTVYGAELDAIEAKDS